MTSRSSRLLGWVVLYLGVKIAVANRVAFVGMRPYLYCTTLLLLKRLRISTVMLRWGFLDKTYLTYGWTKGVYLAWSTWNDIPKRRGWFGGAAAAICGGKS